MALHQIIQRLLLTGADLDLPAAPAVPNAPAALQPLIDAVEEPHRVFDARALVYGHRYRSGFWAIYLLSAVAVLCAMLPLALGWDSSRYRMHTFAGLWALNEVVLIGIVTAIYWLGHRRDWQGQWLHARTTAELTWYLPMLAPLLDPTAPAAEPNWYERVFDPGQHLRDASDVTSLCVRCRTAGPGPAGGRLVESGLRVRLWPMEHRDPRAAAALSPPQRDQAARAPASCPPPERRAVWTHCGRCADALRDSFGVAVAGHDFLPVRSAPRSTARWPQSETYRVGATSERLVAELGCRDQPDPGRARAAGRGQRFAPARAAIKAAMALLLEEHQNWHLLVRPHDLPLHERRVKRLFCRVFFGHSAAWPGRPIGAIVLNLMLLIRNAQSTRHAPSASRTCCSAAARSCGWVPRRTSRAPGGTARARPQTLDLDGAPADPGADRRARARHRRRRRGRLPHARAARAADALHGRGRDDGRRPARAPMTSRAARASCSRTLYVAARAGPERLGLHRRLPRPADDADRRRAQRPGVHRSAPRHRRGGHQRPPLEPADLRRAAAPRLRGPCRRA